MSWISALLRQIVGLLLFISLAELLLPDGAIRRSAHLVFSLLLLTAIFTALPGFAGQLTDWSSEALVGKTPDYAAIGSKLAEELEEALTDAGPEK